ncbi:hypothetical protein FMLHJGGC_00056 [Staphylococcus phage BSwM-KMM1]|nr:hypothetical protein FMLHJGGC_00056 [Pseudomonas phage BSwM KMM1]
MGGKKEKRKDRKEKRTWENFYLPHSAYYSLPTSLTIYSIVIIFIYYTIAKL